MRVLRLPAAQTRSLMVSVTGSTRPSCVRVRRSAPDELGGSSSGLGPLFSRRSPPACSPRGRARDLAGFLATHPKPLPCSKTPAELTRPRPYRPCQHRPPGKPNRRPQRGHNLEANTGLQLPLSTLHERRHRPPCKTRFRLAGCASTGRVSNPLGRFERFQVTSHSPFQDFSCRKVRLRQAPFCGARGGARLFVALHSSRRYIKSPSDPQIAV